MQKILVHYSCSGGLEPVYSSEMASGADIKADISEDIVLKPGERYLVPTGIRLEIPQGYEGQVRPRSGLAVKHGVTVLNTPGTIDADYRGEVKIALINLGSEDFTISRGDRIAQLVFAPVHQAQFVQTENLSETERGSGGFGSTGIEG